MAKKRNLKTWLVMAVFLVGMVPAIAAGGTIYVDADASAGGNGQTWGTACKYLQDALYKPPTGGDQIWVAEGTYKPDEDTANPGGTGVRGATFQLINGVGIYGGFPAGGGDWGKRKPDTYITILSGDLKGDDDGFTNNAENSFHVVTGSGTDATAGLDGFTITGGNANGGVVDCYGGGMCNRTNSSPTVTNCTFSGNRADDGGGGMENENSSPTVTNCTFNGNSVDNLGGGAGFGGGMYNWESSPTVTNCTFTDNSAHERGGGMYNENSSPTVTNCTFSGNSAHLGGGMYNRYYNSRPTVTNCTFSGNSASEFGGGMYNHSSFPTVTNCTFSGNLAIDEGGGMYNDWSSPTVTNCTFSGNSATNGNALACDSWGQMYRSNVQMDNCVLWDGGDEIWNNDGSAITITYSDVQGRGWGTGNINADPLFVDADGADNTPGTEDDNLRLQAGSPCIDASDNTAVPGGITADLDGNPRFVDDPYTADTGNPPEADDIVDMGAYEYQPPIIFVDADATGANNGSSWADAYNYLQDALADAMASGKDIMVAEGIYKPDEDTANPTGTGLRTDTFALMSGVALYGGFPAGGCDFADRNPNQYETILSGDLAGDDVGFTNNSENSYHVVTGSGTDPNAILDGFTITAGNADGSAPNNRGGGMYNDAGSPTVTNCTFSGNSADGDGGGIRNFDHSSPTLTNCTFIGNSATHGGGIYNWDSHPTVTNCTFSGNSARYYGGGIFNYTNSSPTLVNCTFSGNSANSGGGMCNYGNTSSPTLANCILWGNTAPNGAQIYNYNNSTSIVTYSDVQGGWGGGPGNIDENPLFKDADGPDDIPGTEDDNLELVEESPCIDAGDNNSVPADTVDLDEDGNTTERIPLDLAGNARFTDDPLTDDTGVPAPGYPEIVEMGAYERYEFCGDAGHPFPVGDVNRDCKVNFLDIAIIAAHWLEDAGPE